MSGAVDVNRLSLNQITTENWSPPEAIEGCLRQEIETISIWRHKIADIGLKESVPVDTGIRPERVQCMPGWNVSCPVSFRT